MAEEKDNTEMKLMTNIELIRKLNSGEFEKELVHELFSRYADKENMLPRLKIILFLHDVLRAMEYPLVTVECAVDEIIAEMSLEAREERGITFAEFTSYMLYLENNPISKILGYLEAPIAPLTYHNFPPLASVLTVFLPFDEQSDATQEEEKIISPPTNEEIIFHFDQFSPDFVINRTLFPFFCPATHRLDILLLFPDSEALQTFEKDFENSPEFNLFGFRPTISPYSDQTLPIIRDCNHSTLTFLMSKGYLLGQNAVERAKSLGERYEISEKSKQIEEKIYEMANSVDEYMGISEKGSYLREKASLIGAKASESAESLNKSYGIDENLDFARKKISESVEQIQSNETVKSGMSYFGSVYNSMWESLQGIKDETMDKVQKSQQESVCLKESADDCEENNEKR